MKPAQFIQSLAIGAVLLALATQALATDSEAFAKVAARYQAEMPRLNPVYATQLGDHRFDNELDSYSQSARAERDVLDQSLLKKLAVLDVSKLSRAEQVDYRMLRHEIERSIWARNTLREWAWNPLTYTQLAGGAVYGLMAREFAPLPERLQNVTSRLQKIDRVFAEARENLELGAVPKVHAETAINQHGGMMSVVDALVVPELDKLDAEERGQLEAAIEHARAAADVHATWLRETLLPAAEGEFRLGAVLFDQKLKFALDTPLSRSEVRYRAEREYARVREEMFEVARGIYTKLYPQTFFPDNPGDAYKQAIIRAALEEAYKTTPARGEIVEVARHSLESTTQFVRDKNLITLPDDPLEIIVMPEFQRGIALAYCDSPGPLDKGMKTFYAVAPLPEDWSDEQVSGFLKEYNLRSVHELTIHEAMPGHYVQLAHSNRYPSTLRAILQSGPFIEGWAVYAERVMIDAGYYDNDPLMRLIMLKWYLRAVVNAILDQAIHVDGLSEESAMQLMVEGAFQEEREAAGKWVRAQLTSAQLSTYFVGYQEHADLRQTIEARDAKEFELRAYHDKVLSFGSPPVRHVRSLLLKLPVE